jgi:anti-sigma B factor antagonist
MNREGMSENGLVVMKLKRSTAMLRLNEQKRAWNLSTPSAKNIRRKCVNLALTTRTMGDVAVVHCGGKLIFQKEAAALCDVVSEMVRRYRSVVVDLHDVGAIDGGGIGTLAECIRNAKAAGVRLVLCRVPQKVKTLLDLTQVSSMVDIAGSESDALERSRAAA